MGAESGFEGVIDLLKMKAVTFKGGSPVDQVVGAVPKSVLQQRLEKALA